MNKIVILFSFISLNFSSCKQSNFIYIQGNIGNIASRKVYLVKAFDSNSYIDSATNSSNKFVFKIPTKKYSNRLVSIVYVDSNNHKIRSLDFNNHILSSRTQGYSYNVFDIGEENILMTGRVNIRKDSIKGTHIKIQIDSISIKAGIETDALYGTQMMNFGYLEGDVNTKTKNLNTYLSVIHRYPTSQYLLSEINENKTVLSKGELETMLSAFKKESLLSQVGITLTSYANNKSAVTILKNLKLMDENGNKSEIINPASKINMIVLWASWCSPCRQEIPILKKLYDQYHNQGLSITSISIDKNIESWKIALLSEKMNWPQLIVPDNLENSFFSEYEVSSIPDVIFTDANGLILKRFIGFERGQYSIYQSIIDMALKKY